MIYIGDRHWEDEFDAISAIVECGEKIDASLEEWDEHSSRAPADLTVYRLVDDEENEEKKESERGMTTMEEFEKEMKEMNERYDRLAGQLEDVLVELRAVGIAVEKLKANVKSMQDEII